MLLNLCFEFFNQNNVFNFCLKIVILLCFSSVNARPSPKCVRSRPRAVSLRSAPQQHPGNRTNAEKRMFVPIPSPTFPYLLLPSPTFSYVPLPSPMFPYVHQPSPTFPYILLPSPTFPNLPQSSPTFPYLPLYSPTFPYVP